MGSEDRRRVIVDTDAKNEADDQFAVVHALLSPTLDVRGIVPAHFGTRRTGQSMLESRAEVDLLLGLLDMRGRVRVENGAPTAMPDEVTPVDSPGARLIIEEALEDDGPLQVAFLGPLTDMASALLLVPEIARRDVTVIWIGGPPYDDVVPIYWPEFNLSNDVPAANVVFASDVALIQVPMSTYTMVGIGHAELQRKVAGCGRVGEYLVDQLLEWNRTGHTHEPIEHRSLGDSPAVGLMLTMGSGLLRRRPAPSFSADGSYAPGSGRAISVCEAIDARYLLEDMFAKLAEHASHERGER
jgi:inosine-uridine nucleoside N-ribohydrolase